MSEYQLAYVSSKTGKRVDFASPMFLETMANLRAHVWDYTLASRGLTGITRKAREVTVTAKLVVGQARSFWGETLQDMLDLFDADMAYGQPGTLRFGIQSAVASGRGCWTARAFIPKTTYSTIKPGLLELELTIVLCDGVWRRKNDTMRFVPSVRVTSTTLDLPADLPTDLASANITQKVYNPSYTDAEFVARIFGPAVNPQFAIGGNTYRFDNVTVPDGGYLLVVNTGGEKSITLIAENGDRTNRFDSGVRGGGKGSGNYCFELIPYGSHTLTQSGNWVLELDLYTVGGAPKWQS